MHRFGALAFDASAFWRMRWASRAPAGAFLPAAGAHCGTRRHGGQRIDAALAPVFHRRLETFLEDLHRARPTLFVSVPRLLLKFQHGVFAKMPKEKLERLLRIPVLQPPGQAAHSAASSG